MCLRQYSIAFTHAKNPQFQQAIVIFIIQSLLNHVIMSRSDLLLHYCYQNLNYTDVLHINLSADLERIVRAHYSSKNVLELFDIIKTSSYAKDCHIDVILLNQTLPLK
jgi:hypothetical protein